MNAHGAENDDDLGYEDDDEYHGGEREFPEELRIIAKEQAASYSSLEADSMINAMGRLMRIAQSDDPLAGVEWIAAEDLFRSSKLQSDGWNTHWNTADADILRSAEARNQEAVRDALRALKQLRYGFSNYGGTVGPYARNTFPLGRSGLRAVADRGWLLAYFVGRGFADETETYSPHDSWVLSAALVDPCWRATGRP